MSSTDVTINRVNFASTFVVVSVAILNFLFGGVGLIFNVLIFTRPSLRREPFSLYFLSSTYFNLVVIFVIIPVRILSNGFGLELGNYNLGICKTEFFIFYVIRTSSCWLIVLACIDRYLHSSKNARIRHLSSLKMTRRIIGVIFILFNIFFCHMIFYYDITYTSDQFGNITPACSGQKGIYRTFAAIWYMIWYSLCPSFMMLIFGMLIMNNHHQYHRIVPTGHHSNRFIRRTNIQLYRMLIAQVLAIIISTLPFTIYQLYTSLTVNIPKDTLRRAKENLAFTIAATISYFAHSTSFYLYTLTGTIFRKEFFKIIKQRHHPNETDVTINQTQIIRMTRLKPAQATLP